jgi:hypothetical protein
MMKTTALTINGPELALAALEHAAERFNTATEHLTAATKAILMLAVGPLLGLAFAMTLPMISVALTAYYAAKLAAPHLAPAARYLKNVVLFLVAPFVGLAYIIAFPFVGIATMVYIAVKAARK